ncbi:MAG: hypothetical protein HY735_09925 [Verrucomicrobia bacterium]|nr:hypothetical protein [Verrucomicrobiota bacterium]
MKRHRNLSITLVIWTAAWVGYSAYARGAFADLPVETGTIRSRPGALPPPTPVPATSIQMEPRSRFVVDTLKQLTAPSVAARLSVAEQAEVLGYAVRGINAIQGDSTLAKVEKDRFIIILAQTLDRIVSQPFIPSRDKVEITQLTASAVISLMAEQRVRPVDKLSGFQLMSNWIMAALADPTLPRHRLSQDLGTILTAIGEIFALAAREGRPLPTLPEPPPPPPPCPMDSFLPIRTVERGTLSGIAEPLNMIIRDPPQWKMSWDQHQSGRTPKTEPPAVDFNQEMIIFVTTGKDSWTIPPIEIAAVGPKEESLVIAIQRRFRESIFVDEALEALRGLSGIVKYPASYEIIAVPKNNLPAQFIFVRAGQCGASSP